MSGEIFTAVVFGILFGYFLEVAGLGSPKKLNAQFTLQDWTVFKVMFVSVVVAAIGLWLFGLTEVVDFYTFYMPTTYFWGMLLGGALLGMGINIGGYCPGTSVVGFFSGRIDGLFFMIGMLLGTFIFALFYDLLKPLYFAAEGPESQTLAELLHLPVWVVLLLLVIMAVAGFFIGNRFEAKDHGVITSRDLDSDI
ncbi:YeeE/YedE family protein [bacterium]|nr:YeeE/YedE family protein [bacterium]MBU1883710.1 YeeE/YedE family protein [bacterium]